MAKAFKGNLGNYDTDIILRTGLNHENIEGWTNDLRMSNKKKQEVVQEIYKIGKDIENGTISERVIDGFYYPDSSNMSQSKYAGYASAYWRDVLLHVGTIKLKNPSEISLLDDFNLDFYGGVPLKDFSSWYALDSDLTSTVNRQKRLAQILKNRRLKLLEEGAAFYDSNYDEYLNKLNTAILSLEDPSQTGDVLALASLGFGDLASKLLATTEENKIGYSAKPDNTTQEPSKVYDYNALKAAYIAAGYSEEEANKIIALLKAQHNAVAAGWSEDVVSKITPKVGEEKKKEEEEKPKSNSRWGAFDIIPSKDFDMSIIEEILHSEDPVTYVQRWILAVKRDKYKHFKVDEFRNRLAVILNYFTPYGRNPDFLFKHLPVIQKYKALKISYDIGKLLNILNIGSNLFKIGAFSDDTIDILWDKFKPTPDSYDKLIYQIKKKRGGKLLNYKNLFKLGGTIPKFLIGGNTSNDTTELLGGAGAIGEGSYTGDTTYIIPVPAEDGKSIELQNRESKNPDERLTQDLKDNETMWDNYNKYPILTFMDTAADIADINAIFGKHWVIPTLIGSALRGISAGIVTLDVGEGLKLAAVGPISVAAAKGVAKAINLRRSAYGLTGKAAKFLTLNGRLISLKNPMYLDIINKISTRVSPVELKMLEMELAKAGTNEATLQSINFTKNGVFVETVARNNDGKLIPGKEIKVGSRDWYSNFGKNYVEAVKNTRNKIESDLLALTNGKTEAELATIKNSDQYKQLSELLESFNGVNEEIAAIESKIPKVNFNDIARKRWFNNGVINMTENSKQFKDSYATLGTYEGVSAFLNTLLYGDPYPREYSIPEIAGRILAPTLSGKWTKGFRKFTNYSLGSKVIVKPDDASKAVEGIYKGVTKDGEHIVEVGGKTFRAKPELILPLNSGYKEYIPQTTDLHFEKLPSKATPKNIAKVTSSASAIAAPAITNGNENPWEGLKFEMGQAPLIRSNLVSGDLSNETTYVGSRRPYIHGTYYGDDKNIYSFETDSNTGDYQIYNSRGKLLFRGKPESRTKIPGKSATIWDLHTQMQSMYLKGGE